MFVHGPAVTTQKSDNSEEAISEEEGTGDVLQVVR